MTIPKLTNQHRIILSALPIVGAVVFYMYVYKNTNAKIAAQNTLLTEKITKLQEVVDKAEQIGELRKEMDYLEKQQKKAESKIPTNKDLTSLIRQITELLEKHRMNYTNFGAAGLAAKDFYYEYPINISATGNYHSVAEFLTDVVQLDRIITVSAFSMSMKSPTPEDPTSVTVTFVLKTYVYKG